MTKYLCPRYYELYKSAALLARKAIVKAYEELGSISAVADMYGTTRKTVRKVLRRWKEEGEAELPHVPKGKKEYQGFVEHSHQTDDNEFYIPQIERCADLKEFYFRALRWEFMYITRRHDSDLGMTPYRKLRMERKCSKQVALFPVIQLEKLTDLYQKLFPLPGYHVSANDHSSLAKAAGLVFSEESLFS